MRSSFRSWAAEACIPREVAELSLGHAVKGVEGVVACVPRVGKLYRSLRQRAV